MNIPQLFSIALSLASIVQFTGSGSSSKRANPILSRLALSKIPLTLDIYFISSSCIFWYAVTFHFSRHYNIIMTTPQMDEKLQILLTKYQNSLCPFSFDIYFTFFSISALILVGGLYKWFHRHMV